MDLPDYLKDRVRVLKNTEAPGPDKYVLYWMHHAMRGEENAALDVARTVAAQRQLPLLVYQELRSGEEFASDRHHTFVLEGVRDVQRQMEELGIAYAFHLETQGSSTSHLKDLATHAAVVVTEEYPVEPIRTQIVDVMRSIPAELLAVDASCVVPMQSVDRAYDRAFQFRRRTKNLYEQRVAQEWSECSSLPKPYPLGELPFETPRLDGLDLAEIVSRCEIDHSVGPVCDTVGGSTAGYERWNRFKRGGLREYGRKRNDPLQQGVSRMSPYLHYGMVSANRLAREARHVGGDGAEKYLDELLIWRELAFNYCFHRDDHDHFTTLPGWALETLRNHADDLRPQLLAWESLMRGRSGDLLWDAAQRSLLIQGELHNNVRMTWGKAFLEWSESPEVALQYLIDLNHRFALDGRDPASYGGILWCLGQFDRPFFPEQFVIGTVRPRPTVEHAKRIDVEKYNQFCSTLRVKPRPKIAVIGAGVSGLFAARALADAGVEVSVFEKSRGVGGRMATRRSGDWRFDHGAQYFTIRDARLRHYIESWQELGVVEPWNASIVRIDKEGHVEASEADESLRRWVPTPTMNSLCKHLATDLDISVQTRCDRVVRSKQVDARRLQLIDDQEQSMGDFDYVLVAVPAGQAAEILRDFAEVASHLSQITMSPCWATMAAFDHPLAFDWGGAFIDDEMLAWAARGSSRPQRKSEHETLVLHATPSWTSQHLELSREEVAAQMIARFKALVDLRGATPCDLQAHRWMFARAADLEGPHVYFDGQSGVSACGDWTNGERVEAALLSGMAAVGRLMGDIAANAKRTTDSRHPQPQEPLAQPT